jgi:hypothetical protein
MERSIQHDQQVTMTMPRREISTSHQNQPIVVYPPRSIDIIFGRGRPFQDHPGNVRMNNIIRQYKSTYQKVGMHEKKTVTETVVSAVISNDHGLFGKVRFLKQKKAGIYEPWYEASSVEIWKKVNHSLRCTKQYSNKNFLKALSTRTTGTVVPLLSSFLEAYEEGSSLLEDCLTAIRNGVSSPVSSFALKDKDVLREETVHEDDDDPLVVALPIVQLSTRMIMKSREEEELFGDINDFQDNDPGYQPPPPPSIFDVDDNELLITPFDEGRSSRLAKIIGRW